MTYKLGSLFDGSGGFPLAGALCGVEPVWAAEVEPYPIAVTRSRFPNMKHLGDISKVNGAEIEPVDIVSFGSPCQDLSVAGLRRGLKHEANGDEETTRSGLFMEAVRIIKEMRTATNGEYPRFALWENVPGAFSSNRGEDFRIVLEELIRVTTPDASMPPVPKAGWNYADSYTLDGASLAYRVLDAQYWGVPQRRRRIYLVADFRAECAREVLFEREGLRGYFAEGRTPWQAAPADAQGSTGADDPEGEGNGNGRGRQLDAVAQPIPYTLKIRGGVEVDSAGKSAGKGALIQENKSATLGTSQDQYLFQPITDSHILDDQGDSVMNVRTDGKAPTLRAQMGGHPPVVMTPIGVDCYNLCTTGDKGRTVTTASGGLNEHIPVVMVPQGCDTYNGQITGDKATTLTTKGGDGTASGPSVICMATQQGGAEVRTDDKAPTITAAAGMSGNNQPVICLQGNGIDRADTAGCNGKGWKEDTSYTLNTIDRPAVAYGLDRASFNQGQNAKFDFSVQEESQPTLTARGPGAVCCTNYIVRRLTPTECARLQGFADWWSYVEPKDTLTDEEYRFWLEVRNTHARINGRAMKDYTVKQMLTWYNKLYTDSAEYKMWGNGIALPTALYVLQGITDALNNTEEDESWML